MARIKSYYSHQQTQCKALLKLLKDDKFSDVTFIIGPQQTEFTANRALLSAHSDVFEAMFYGQMMESQLNSEVEIQHIDPDAFKNVLKYCYCNEPKLTAKNIISVQQIADKYQIEGLSKLCTERFETILSKDNFCLLLQQSVNAKLDNFVTKCQEELQSFSRHTTNELVVSSEFKAMDLDSMKIFLQCDGLDIKEDWLWDAVLGWSKKYKYKKDTDTASNDEVNKQIEDEDDDLNVTTSNNGGKRKLHDRADEMPQKKRKLMGQSDDLEDKDENEISNKSLIDEERLELLKEVSPFIRFTLMDKKYFETKVKKLKLLNDKQLNFISAFHDGICGGFNIKPRKIKRNYY